MWLMIDSFLSPWGQKPLERTDYQNDTLLSTAFDLFVHLMKAKLWSVVQQGMNVMYL